MARCQQESPPLHVVILMPLRDDWASAAELTRRLDQTISSYPCTLDVVFADDGSTQPCIPADFQSAFSAIRSIQRLRLRRNLGHQRAIAIGLAHVERSLNCDAVLVMDADGEDTPDGALQLIRTFLETSKDGCAKAVFAERSRRTETVLFRLFYKAYKVLHYILTGVRVRVGNFSIIPHSSLSTLVVMPELWNHYAASFFRSGLLVRTIPIPRGYRIAGKSKMNFVNLVAHGLSAISVFGDIVGVRLLIGATAGLLLAGIGIVGIAMIRFLTNRAIPGWATYASGTLIILMTQFISLVITFSFTILSSRSNLGFVPLRDFGFFVADVESIYCHD